jgi:carbamoyltransferase
VIKPDAMKGSYLGPSYDDSVIEEQLDQYKAKYQRKEGDEFYSQLAGILAEGKVVGWFQGKMEFGPRALGARSIIGDPRNEKMQSIMNLKIKYRESFRPFAPSILADKVSDVFEHEATSPYMLMVAPIVKERRVALTKTEEALFGIDRLNCKRSDMPAITHVDYSARIQTVHEETNPAYHQLLSYFNELTGCPVLVNTSFNVRGEPIVCTPDDAYRCFMRTEMDYLVIDNYILEKTQQPNFDDDSKWKEEFTLD